MTMTAFFAGVRRSIRVLLTTAAVALASLTPAVLAQAPGPWKSLFNGKDLTGWTIAAGRGGAGGAGGGAPAAPPPPANWKVEDGVLVGGHGDRRGSLVSNDQYKDFELEMEFLLAEHGTQCSAELIGDEQANASKEKSCLFNSGVSFRTGYQVNLGRREAGEYIGIVVHRKAPGAIRGNVLWLDRGDDKFPNLRKKQDWNQLRISAKGSQLTVFLNGTKICDVKDDPTDPAEAKWKEAGPISIQWPYSVDPAFAGFVKYRNIRIREL